PNKASIEDPISSKLVKFRNYILVAALQIQKRYMGYSLDQLEKFISDNDTGFTELDVDNGDEVINNINDIIAVDERVIFPPRLLTMILFRLKEESEKVEWPLDEWTDLIENFSSMDNVFSIGSISDAISSWISRLQMTPRSSA